MEENKKRETDLKKEPNVLPATEIAKNPNPRANENLPDTKKTAASQKGQVDSEITDGEDG